MIKQLEGPMLQESDILQWIGEEVEKSEGPGSAHVTSLQLLFVRASLANRHGESDLTRSLELSMSKYEREVLFKLLRGLAAKGWIVFARENGTPMEDDPTWDFDRLAFSGHGFGYLGLTEHGWQELAKIQKLHLSLNFRK